MPAKLEATELYRNAEGRFAAITYCAGPKGHTVALHGLKTPYRVRFLDIESARLTWGVLRLKLRLEGYEKRKPETRAA
jgi:hypothetical protein